MQSIRLTIVENYVFLISFGNEHVGYVYMYRLIRYTRKAVNVVHISEHNIFYIEYIYTR